MDSLSRTDKLLLIADDISKCTKCPLHETRIKAVPGRGCSEPLFLFVGEGPGKEEDEQGLPFVGDSGFLLDIWLEYLDLTFNDYAITNIVKCRPPNNRDPKTEEINICTDWLKQQLAILRPEIVIPIGAISSAYFLGKTFKTGITKYGGNFHSANYLSIYPVPHPSYFLRHGNKGREEMWKPYFEELLEWMEENL